MVDMIADGKVLKVVAFQNQTSIAPEQIMINLDERTIISVKMEYPSSTKHQRVLNLIKQMYGYLPPSMRLVISHVPKDSTTSKTLSDELLYLNVAEIQIDYQRLTNMIFSTGGQI